jgi:putative copper resistance protein D
VDLALLAARALHFTATVSLSGVVFFCIFVAEPALRPMPQYDAKREAKQFYDRLRLIFWISLILAGISGVAWFFCVVTEISDRPASETFSDDTAWTVLSDTEFGHIWIARLFIGALLAATVWIQSQERKPNWCSLFQALLAAAFVASLAWAGHAAATLGLQGDIHLASDVLHLVAVCAWVGGLLPYAILLKTFQREPAAILATRRFSDLGILAVGTILVTGIVNTWSLVGSVGALFGTEYGRLLMAKMVLFLVMVGVAAVNRLQLSPRLEVDRTTSKLERNSLIEAGLGIIVLFIIGALGTLPPAIHDYAGHVH